MSKLRLAAISLLVVAASFVASFASAHWVNSTYQNIRVAPYTFSHPAPFLRRADYTVGYKNGVWNITTNVESKTANEWVQAWNYCYTGFGYIFVSGNAEWKTAVGQWSSAASCGGAGLVQGAESVSN